MRRTWRILLAAAALSAGADREVLTQASGATLIAAAEHACDTELFQSMECHESLLALEKYTEINVSDALALKALGVALFNRSEIDELSATEREALKARALVILRQAVSIPAATIDVLLACAFRVQGEEQASLLRRVLLTDPSNVPAAKVLARIYLRASQIDESLASYRIVMASDYQGRSMAIGHRGFALQLEEQQRRAEAIEVLSSLLRHISAEPLDEQCDLAADLDPLRYSQDKVFTYRLRELKARCR